MKTCFILVGVSGSGKSTVRNQLVQQLRSVGQVPEIFSLDDCRLGFFDQITDDPKKAYTDAFDYANANKALFDSYVTGAWTRAMLTSDVVIVDNTNLTKKSRARWINEARARGFMIWAVQVMAPLQVVLDRQNTRGDKKVPEEIVRDMYMRQQEVLVGNEADVLMNVDGTASNVNLFSTSYFT